MESLYCHETLEGMEPETSDKENAPPVANRHGVHKLRGRFARSDALSDKSTATLCPSEVRSSTYQFQYARHAQRAVPLAEPLHRDVAADPPRVSCFHENVRTDTSVKCHDQYVDMYCRPLRVLYPIMVNGVTTECHQPIHQPIHHRYVPHHHHHHYHHHHQFHLDYPPYRRYTSQPSQPVPFWAFEKLPDKICMTSKEDGEVMTRSNLKTMTEIQIQEGEKHFFEVQWYQAEDSDCRLERCRAIRWMCHRCTEQRLNRKTLFLAVAYLDKYITESGTKFDNIMREAAACLVLACKLEEVNHPPLEVFCRGLGIECTEQDLKEWMLAVKLKLNWMFILPNIYDFLKFFILHINATNEVQAWAMYLAELCLMDFTTLKFRPAVAAIACLAVALARCNALDWHLALSILSDYMEKDLADKCKKDVKVFMHTLIQLQHEAAAYAQNDAAHYLRPVVDRFKSRRMHYVSQQKVFDWNLAMVLLA